MAKPPCVFHFHCGGLTSSRKKEHTFPAALGGRRVNSKILCEPCQERFGKRLDEVLPAQLRVIITKLGVVGDHARRPARTELTDPLSGHRYLVDHAGIINAPKPVVLEQSLTESGKLRARYIFRGADAEKAFFAELKTRGQKFEILDRRAEAFVMAAPLEARADFGGEDALRATARIALNFLAAHFAVQTRAKGLEPLKSWILGSAGVVNNFAHFGAPLPSEAMPPLIFPNGHRVVLAFDGQRAFARVVLFDIYEMAIALGSVDADMGQMRAAFDINPFTKDETADLVQVPEDSIGATSAELGRMMLDEDKDEAALESRVNERLLRLLRRARDQEVEDVLTRLAADVRVALGLHQGQLRINELVGDRCLQFGVNLVVTVIRQFADRIEQAGDPNVAAFLRDMSGPSGASVEAQKPVKVLASGVLMQMAPQIADAVASGESDNSQLRSLLDGEAGLAVANRVVGSALRTIFQSSPPAPAD